MDSHISTLSIAISVHILHMYAYIILHFISYAVHLVSQRSLSLICTIILHNAVMNSKVASIAHSSVEFP